MDRGRTGVGWCVQCSRGLSSQAGSWAAWCWGGPGPASGHSGHGAELQGPQESNLVLGCSSGSATRGTWWECVACMCIEHVFDECAHVSKCVRSRSLQIPPIQVHTCGPLRPLLVVWEEVTAGEQVTLGAARGALGPGLPSRLPTFAPTPTPGLPCDMQTHLSSGLPAV